MADETNIPPNVPHVCVDKELPVEVQVDAAERAVVENPANVPVFRHRPGLGVAPSPLSMALITGKKWKNGRALHVRFLAGNPDVQAKVRQFAVQWCDFANLGIVFDGSADPEIRIAFGPTGSWSYIGTDNLSIAPGQPTMNYGWFGPGTHDDEYSRVVLHEFGHALGCIHEHQHPDSNIPGTARRPIGIISRPTAGTAPRSIATFFSATTGHRPSSPSTTRIRSWSTRSTSR